MKKILYPSLSEILLLLVWTSGAVFFGYVAFKSAWTLGYTSDSLTNTTIISKFDPDASSVGFLLFGFLLFASACELLGRSVTIETGSISSRSPLGIYRQVFRKAEISDVRITPILGWGRILELNVGGRWIVFLANTRFTDQPQTCIFEERGSNQSPQTTRAFGPRI